MIGILPLLFFGLQVCLLVAIGFVCLKKQIDLVEFHSMLDIKIRLNILLVKHVELALRDVTLYLLRVFN